MTALMQEYSSVSIIENILSHPTWHGLMSGLQAEKLLRGKNTPYLFLLRKGELNSDYYITFILPDFSIKHQPFTVTESYNGWCYENGGPGGPFEDTTIDDVLHLIMHCRKDECVPYTKRMFLDRTENT